MASQKRQTLPRAGETQSVLWVAATPIGNLGDVTERLRSCLKAAEFIFCEDTRKTRELTTALGLEVKADQWVRLDQNVEGEVAERWAQRLSSGAKAVLVSDAGTPGIQDPGSFLVRECKRHGVRVEPVAGCSSLAAFWSVSGMVETSTPLREFLFCGYADRDMKGFLERLSNLQLLSVSTLATFFESPHRITSTLEGLAQAIPSAQILVAKEMTKIYEQFWTGEASAVSRQILDHVTQEGEKGEWVFGVAVGGGLGKNVDSTPGDPWKKLLEWLHDPSFLTQPPKVIAREISQVFGASARDVYQELLRFKKN